MAIENKALINYYALKDWFDNFYRPQLEQAQRAERTNTSWSANDGEKEYTTLAGLDAEANVKQAEIRSLKLKLAE